MPGRAAEVVAAAADAGINLRLLDADRVGIAVDETTSPAQIEAVWAAFGVTADYESVSVDAALPADHIRTSAFLTHPVFHRYRSETEFLRYVRSLADKDIALDRSMIPLGSCTMKLNATTEMIPVTWPEFGALHPFAPRDQADGYRELIEDLEAWLAEITGYDAVSVQPNAGSQGELAGLLAIRDYHRQRGEAHRDVCLIPSSAHGTNAASAVMAGLRVVVVACDDDGDVDVADLRAKVAEHGENLAALMVTYPSTHGVFEEQIGEVCAAVHDAGGQVYLDGANLNAMVGIARPGHVRRRRVAPQPPQDVLHPPRRRRSRRRPGGGAGPPGAVPARSSRGARGRSRGRPGPRGRGPLGLGRDPAHLVGLHRPDGPRWPAPGHRGGHPQRQLRGHPPEGPLPGALHRRAAAWWPTSASSTCGA